MGFFFDSYAIIKLILHEESYAKYKKEQIITNSLHLSEVAYFLLRTGNNEGFEELPKLDFIILDITKEIALEAAKFRFKHKSSDFSYADCIGYITAVKNNLAFLTGDFPFKSFDNVEFAK